jgi:Xaa-Pro aminopeptidase
MLVEWMHERYGPDSVVPASDVYGRIKYEKSDMEMALTRDATLIGDAAMRAMLAVLKPGMRETQVAGWGYLALRQLGAEETGVDIMVTSGEANRTLIGKALNRVIQPGDMVHLGVSARRDGLCGCTRRSVVALEPGQPMPAGHRYWLDFVADAYRAGHEQFIVTARDNLPANTIEKAVVDFVAGKSEEVLRRLGHSIDLVRQKPYTCVHNSGYTECMEFYGAVTLASQQPLGNQIVNMLDVAMRGIGNHWQDVIIPGLDYVVVENTFGKTGRLAECLNTLAADCQPLVGRGVD